MLLWLLDKGLQASCKHDSVNFEGGSAPNGTERIYCGKKSLSMDFFPFFFTLSKEFVPMIKISLKG